MMGVLTLTHQEDLDTVDCEAWGGWSETCCRRMVPAVSSRCDSVFDLPRLLSALVATCPPGWVAGAVLDPPR